MTSALANNSDRGVPYSGFWRPIRNPSLLSPDKAQRVPKEPGSKKLVHGQWITVKPGDEDASDRCAHDMLWSENCDGCGRQRRVQP